MGNVFQLEIIVLLELILVGKLVCLSLLAQVEEFGTLSFLNVFVLLIHSGMEILASTAEMANYMKETLVATAPMELTSMDLDVPKFPIINVPTFLTQFGVVTNAFVIQDMFFKVYHVFVMVLNLMDTAIDAIKNLIQSGNMAFVNVRMDITNQMDNACPFKSTRTLLPLHHHATLQLSSTTNKRDVYHVLMVVSPAQLVTHALNVVHNTISALQVDFVPKYAEMEKDSHWLVMMVTM